MKILKKFNNFIINEEIENLDEFPGEEMSGPMDNTPTQDVIEGDPQDSMDVEDGPEVEEDEYVGTQRLRELADRLGSTVVDNAVEYEGKTINFFSETECFHVDREKFETVDEVVDYLTGGVEEPSAEISEVPTEDPDEMHEKFVLKKFKDIKRTR